VTWDPHDESYAREEAGFVDPDGDLAISDPKPDKKLLMEAGVSVLYSEPVSVAALDAWIDHQCKISALSMGNDQPEEDDTIHFNEDGICMSMCDLSTLFEEEYLSDELSEQVQQSKFEMAAGATYVNLNGCKLFKAEEIVSAVAEAMAAIAAIKAGDRSGVSPAVLAKIWRIPLK